MMTLPVFYLLRLALTAHGLYFDHVVGFSSPSSVKAPIGILVRIALKLQNAFVGIIIFTILIPQLHKHKRFFHFIVTSSMSFTGVLNVLL